jgi:RNA polymerase sigma factor (sigma-70 family)
MSPRIPIRLLAAQSDQRLLALVREGHERAFEALVHRYRRQLLRYCRRSMRLSEERAEDVLQHALLQAWLALTGGIQVLELKPWLYRIVHNAAVNLMRSSSENVTELTDAMHARMTGAIESDLDRKIAVHEALSNVAALPQMQRQAIFLTAVDGQTHEEVAEALGITHGAVRGLLHRARRTLRSAAAAITPQSLIQWASGGAGAYAPSTERLAELSASGGAIGMTGVLAKGAAIAVTAGALVTGAAVVHSHGHAVDRSHARTSALPRSTGGAGQAGIVAGSSGVATGRLLAAPQAPGTSTRDIAAAHHLLRARVAPGQLRQAHRALAVSRAKPDAAGGTKAVAGTPGRDENADLAEGAGSGASSGSRTHGGQDSRGEPTHGADSSGNGPTGGGSGGGSGSGGRGSDGSGGHEAEPLPSTGQGEAGEALGQQAGSSGDHVAVSAEPASKTEG